MTTIIKELKATFDANRNAVLTVPNGTVIITVTFYENAPHDVGQEIGVIALIEDPQSIPGTHPRLFTMIPEGPLPTNFKKYIGTVPYGPQKTQMFVIELEVPA